MNWKIGDRVSCPVDPDRGYGTVTEINSLDMYPIKVKWDNATQRSYREDGTQMSETVYVRKLTKLERALS